MKSFRDLAMENKKLVLFFSALVVFGAAILILGRLMPEPEEYIRETFFADENGGFDFFEAPAASPDFSYEQAIEARLEEFFSLVENAGRVRVMVSSPGARETVFVTDANTTRSYTTEQDAQGGSRETRHYQSSEKTVLVSDRQGTDMPIVLRETEPRIEGVVIIAEGGDCPFVRDALTRAARAVLGLEAHMIQVLTMAA